MGLPFGGLTVAFKLAITFGGWVIHDVCGLSLSIIGGVYCKSYL
jgi:hypothetical protein